MKWDLIMINILEKKVHKNQVIIVMIFHTAIIKVDIILVIITITPILIT